MSKKVAVIGAGLVGSLQAIYLAKRGYKVEVYEKRPDQRKAEILAGKSINLALSDRGWKALEGVGIADEIRKMAIPMKGRLMHSVGGELTFQPYGKEGQAIYSVSRGGLNQKLMNIAEPFENIDYFFNMKCKAVNLEKNSVTFQNTQSNRLTEIVFDKIYGTDGAFSKVRSRLQKTDRFNYTQTYLNHGYKELTIPPNEDGSHKIEKNALHIWPREQFMLIALPNLDGSFTVTLFLPFEGEDSFEKLKTEKAINDFFNQYFPDAKAVMPTLIKDFFENPTSSLVTVKCAPWNYQDKVVLLGDAAHAIVPFYGQGMNSGFEDCTVLNQMADEVSEENLFEEFSKRRKPDGDAIADLALQNFIEMRDLTGDPDFLLRKKIEKRIAEKYPEKWLPQYSQVTFSHIPYSKAQENGKKQKAIMDKIMGIKNIQQIWDSEEIEAKILSFVN